MKKLKTCSQHITEKEKLPYLAWHAKAERSRGKQQRCPECRRLFFSWEMVKPTARSTARPPE